MVSKGTVKANTKNSGRIYSKLGKVEIPREQFPRNFLLANITSYYIYINIKRQLHIHNADSYGSKTANMINR